VMAADGPYGEFYDFCSFSREYFGYTLVHYFVLIHVYIYVSWTEGSKKSQHKDR
jgi:hypothetical protein